MAGDLFVTAPLYEQVQHLLITRGNLDLIEVDHGLLLTPFSSLYRSRPILPVATLSPNLRLYTTALVFNNIGSHLTRYHAFLAVFSSTRSHIERPFREFPPRRPARPVAGHPGRSLLPFRTLGFSWFESAKVALQLGSVSPRRKLCLRPDPTLCSTKSPFRDCLQPPSRSSSTTTSKGGSTPLSRLN